MSHLLGSNHRHRDRLSWIAIAALFTFSQTVGAQRPACYAKPAGATDLTTADGRTVYIEPNSFAVDETEAFLAGRPNYVFKGDSLELRNRIFGVLTNGSSGDARIVQSPVGDRTVGAIRVVSLGKGRWAAVFAEVGSDRTFLHRPRDDLWFATFDGRSWTKTQKLPRLSKGVIRSEAASSLIRSGGRLTIAYPLDSVSSDLRSSVAVFSRRRDGWSVQVLQTRMVASVGLIAVDGEVRVAVGQPDTSQRSDGGSVFLYEPGPEWRSLGKLIAGGESYTDDPVIRAARGDVTISWHARLGGSGSFGEARTARLSVPALRGTRSFTPVQKLVTLDSSSIQLSVPEGAHNVLWISEHVIAETAQAPKREFRIFSDSAQIPVLVARAPDDYDGTLFGAAITAHPRQLLIAGPSLRHTTDGTGVLMTRILRFRLDCAGP